MKISRILSIGIAIALLTVTAPAQQAFDDDEIHIWPVHGNVYLLVGGGSNITLSVGKDGVLMVDAGAAQITGKVIDAIQKFTHQLDPFGPPLPIRYLINTAIDADHTGGNANIASSSIFKPLEGGEIIIAHDNVLTRMAEAPEKAQPTHTYQTEQYKLNRFFNGEGVQVVHMPAAHTDGDSIVWFRFSDVISTGDIFTDSYPVIDLQQGGSVQGLLNALNQIIDLMFPEFRVQGGTMLIPGHGRVSDLTDIAYYRDMVTIVRDRVQDMIKRGLTLDQVKVGKVTADFDPIYNRRPGASEKFVEAVYRSLAAKK